MDIAGGDSDDIASEDDRVPPGAAAPAPRRRRPPPVSGPLCIVLLLCLATGRWGKLGLAVAPDDLIAAVEAAGDAVLVGAVLVEAWRLCAANDHPQDDAHERIRSRIRVQASHILGYVDNPILGAFAFEECPRVDPGFSPVDLPHFNNRVGHCCGDNFRRCLALGLFLQGSQRLAVVNGALPVQKRSIAEHTLKNTKTR